LAAEKFNRSQAAAWLAGFIDGEGCVYFHQATYNGKNHQTRVITVGNTDRCLIEAASTFLTLLGIDHSTHKRLTSRKKDFHVVEIRRGPAMWRFRELIPIQAPEKVRRLDLALKSYRGLHCAACGCLHDERTEGCLDCRKRHERRAYAKAYRERV